MFYLESLADSWVKHDPVHPSIHPNSPNEEILLFHLLFKYSFLVMNAMRQKTVQIKK